MRAIGPSAVVLLHDGECADEDENVAAVGAILTELGKRDYIFRPLPKPCCS